MEKKHFRFQKRWILLISCLLTIFSMVTFRHSIFRTCVEIYLSAKIKGYGGWKFDYQTVSLKRDGLYFKDVSLKTRGVGARVSLQSLKCLIEKTSHSFEPRFLIEEPLIEIEKVKQESEFDLSSLMKGPLERFKVDITDGLLKFVDADGRVDIHFSLDGDAQRRSVGIFYLSEHPLQEEKISAMVKLYQWPKELIIESELRETSVVWLSRIINFFQPTALKEWTGLTGVVSGHSWIGLDDMGKVIQTTANLGVESFSCLRKNGDFEMKVEEFSLDVSFPSGGKKIEKREVWWQSLALKSQIKGGEARFKDAEWGADFSLSDIGGTLNFSTFKDSTIEIKGFLHQSGETSPIVLSGRPSLVDSGAIDIDMKLFLEPEVKTSTHLNLSVSAPKKDTWLVRGRLTDIDAPQIKMFQHLIGFAMPQVKDVHFKKGIITCELSLEILEGSLSKLLLENMIGDELEIYSVKYDLASFAAKIEASAQLDLTEKEQYHFPSWKVKIEEGEVIKGFSSEKPLTFSEINLEVFMCRDVFEPSWAKTKVEDVAIELEVVGFYSEANIKLNLATSLARSIRFFKEGDFIVPGNFDGYGVNANFGLRRQLGSWDVIGCVKLDVQGNWIDQVDLSCSLSDLILDYDKCDLITLLKKSVSRGNFHATNISCEVGKIIREFSGGDWDIEGMVSIEGVFSSKGVDLELETSYLTLQTPAVDIRLNSVLDSSLKTSEGKFHYDFDAHRLQAFFPLHQGVIREKEIGLLFSDVKGSAYYDGKLLRFEEVECEIEGLQVAGLMSMRLTPQEEMALKITTSQISGSLGQLVQFLHNIEPLKKLEIPFEGQILSGEEGFNLSMFFHQNGPADLDWEGQFSLSHGTLPLLSDISLTDLRFDFIAASADNKLQVSNLLGKLQSNKIRGEYLVSAKEIELTYADQAPLEATFDLRLENSVMDLIRLVGEYDGKQKKFLFAEDLTHLFGCKSGGIKLDLTDEFHVKDLDLLFTFLPPEAGLMCRVMQDLGVAPQITQAMIAVQEHLSNPLETQLFYTNGLWKASLETAQFAYGEMKPAPLTIHAEWNQNSFKVIDSSWGYLSLSGSVKKDDLGTWVEGLTLTFDEEKISFEKGKVLVEEGKLSLPLIKSNFHLGKFISNAPSFALDGCFNLLYTPDHSFPLSVIYQGEMVIDHFSQGNFVIASMSPVHIEYNTDKGLLIKESVFCLEEEKSSLAFEVPMLTFLADEKTLQGYRIKTNLTDELVHYFAKKTGVAHLVKELILPSDTDRSKELVFDFEYTEQQLQIGGTLPKGIYRYKGQTFDLEKLHFNLNDRFWEFTGGLNCLTQTFDLNVRVNPYHHFDTVIEMVGHEQEERPAKQALYTECKLKDEEGVSIQKIEGDLFGIDFHFVPKTDLAPSIEGPVFLGTIKFDIEKMHPLLNESLKELVDELKLKKGYELSGELSFQEKSFKKPVFNGHFKARDFDLLGYRFKTCFSSIHIDQEQTELKEFKISDDAITVDAKEIHMTPQKDGDMALDIPEILLRDLRPSLLQKPGAPRGKVKPFHIKRMSLSEVTGMLSEPKTLKGKGSLSFINTFKQGANLLDIPIELISRLGLDIGLLVPIQGEMDYFLKDGKLIFTKLKNSFSDNKRSYFYLWNKTESYIDLEGNMHIDIRMKQYVLFKITELFVLSINGTLETPKFSLK